MATHTRGPHRHGGGRARRIRASAPGHAPKEVEIAVPVGGSEARTLVLEPRPPPSGWLLISAGAVEAELRVDGEP